MIREHTTIDQDATTALQLFRLMRRDETEATRLEAIITVAATRLCKWRSPDDVQRLLVDTGAGLPASTTRPEEADAVARRPTPNAFTGDR